MARLYGPGPGDPPPLVATVDLAGLSTNDVEGSPVGTLVGALSDERSGLIRYLDVEMRSADKHVLVPIGHARIDREAVPPRVRLRAATYEDLLGIPEFVEGSTALDAGYQEEVMRGHGRLFYGSRYYAHPAYGHDRTWTDATVSGPDGDGKEGSGVRPLSELSGFRVVRGQPELVGWALDDVDGEHVGTIRDLLVEPAARKARYVVVELEEPRRTTAIPVGYVSADPDGTRATTVALDREDVRLLPPYEPPMTREEENRLQAAIEGRLSGDRYFDRADFYPLADGV
jgi:hypothetical protein